ncbi:tryptophan halogenase [Cellvibrio zantedeschiae]|uniref:Tryptophan halogenase n=1 Tax=Cellvibrio zantedeschiae TaxID=1237077 RepID=A0ABQ3B419_9GAMM|nr:tryptophan halogenase family protein [Cellvibrio zantedeschiae]GGY77440.1 tryptophan halogenase [Cellvibrio zantedeschiae]
MNNQTIKNIVVVGGGTAGWMTAAALSKTVGCQNYNITLVESEQIGTVGVGEATIPMITLFNNNVMGFDEHEFVRETNATFKLGIEFVNWRKQGHSYFHPFGLLGVDMDGISFMHYWLRWQKAGGTLDYSKFNAETEAARAFKFMHTPPQMGAKLMPDINYAYQFDASLYAVYLRKHAAMNGVKRIEGKINEVKQDPTSGFIQAVVLENGEQIQGDLFIDCSGFRGLLIEQTLKAGYEDWSHWLPVNRALAVPCESAGELLPYTRATAQEAGWQWRIPLQHRTGNGYVYSSEFISDEDARTKLLERLDGKPQAEPKPLRFVTGMRKKCWEKNCIAMGLASGFLEPLESTSIHLVQVSISKLLTMFPKDGFSDVLINRYNKEMEFEYDNIKDFLIAHYKVTEREDTPFWRYVKNMSIPDSLAEKLEIFKTRGEVMARQSELFKETSWFAVLAGQGLMPEGYHPIADSISEDELRLRLTKIRTGVQNRVNSMPNHADYIRENCRSVMSKL